MIDLKNFKNHLEHFQLGGLTTESFNDKTKNLSQLSLTDLGGALDLFKEVDEKAFECVLNNLELIESLKQSVERAFAIGGSVILVGCGATGRLCLSLEKDYKPQFGEKVISLMAGGDSALVRSIEKFEDGEQLCHDHLDQIQIQDNDLIIAITEGGETPFVLAALDYALEKTMCSPWLIYCNPASELMGVERSRKHLLNDKVQKLELLCGAQAISGSTRLQASSVQLLSMVLVFESLLTACSVKDLFDGFQKSFQKIDYKKLSSFIEWETNIYKSGEKVLYKTSNELSLIVFTDTTERAPTFSLTPFKNKLNNELSSPVGLELSDTRKFWENTLGRDIRIINFEGIFETSYSYMKNFEFKNSSLDYSSVQVVRERDLLKLEFSNESIEFHAKEKWQLFFILKLLLNAHSTLVMCRLGRVEGNMMVWVKPSNFKLIDRTIRYTKELLYRDGIDSSYDECMQECLNELDHLKSESSFVLRLVERLKRKYSN